MSRYIDMHTCMHTYVHTYSQDPQTPSCFSWAGVTRAAKKVCRCLQDRVEGFLRPCDHASTFGKPAGCIKAADFARCRPFGMPSTWCAGRSNSHTGSYHARHCFPPWGRESARKVVEVQPEEPALPAAPSVETAAAAAAVEARLAPNFGNIGSGYIRMGEKVDSIIQDTNAVFRAVRENGWNLFEPGSLNSHTFGALRKVAIPSCAPVAASP